MPIPVSNAYEYYDQKTELYEPYFEKSNIINRIDSETDFEMPVLKLFSDKKLILQGNISLIASHDINLSVWQWGWNLPFYNKSENYIARKLLHYAMDIDVFKEKDPFGAAIFKSELLNSKIHLQWPKIEIEKLLAISLYLTKSDYYYIRPIINIEIQSNTPEPIAYMYYLIKNITVF